MTKLKVNLLGKFAITYMVLLVMALAVVYALYFKHKEMKMLGYEVQEVQMPTIWLLREFEVLLFESQNTGIAHDKIANKYSTLKKEYKNLVAVIGKDESSEKFLNTFEALLISREELIKLLTVSESGTSELTSISVDNIKRKIENRVSNIKKMLEGVIQAQERKVSSVVVEMERADDVLVVLVILLLLIFIIGCLLSLYHVREKLYKPLTQLRNIIVAISEGKLVNADFKIGQDQVMTNALVNLINDLKERTAFAVAIGNGNYDNDIELRSEDDGMSRALLEMKENLKRNAKEEKQRNWIVSGLAQFADIIRSKTDLKLLANSIISEMVKYTNSNQGALFIVEGNDEGDAYLKMAACYAWDKKRFVDKEIQLGEGLTGECWQEGEPIFITQVPQEYVHITSGLGEATPGCVFIAPLKVNEDTYGILELATFRPYEEYEREFILKVSENIASAIFSAKMNTQTQNLLELSQQQAEEMRASEEELRQNMEELQSTQEAAERRNVELERAGIQAEAQKQSMSRMLEKLKEKEKQSDEQRQQLRVQGEELLQNMEKLRVTQEAAEKRNAELERSNAQAEAQKQTMSKMLERLRQKENEKQEQTEQLKAQEEVLRQNMEELQRAQEVANKKNLELERANAQAEAQKQSMARIISKLRETERQNKEQAKELRAQEGALRQSMEELLAVQEEKERARKVEESKSVEVQKKLTQELVAKLKTAEEEVKRLRSMNQSQN
ncbi:GAF domain-containing protein [Fulvivirga sp. 29W222]|uniref:GAF domain-containing protein n=1 Tax=Fulvivirga marina TaxID=2494733 RepID=A0A937FYP7_9BACT|nr:GAF domain-containing protein [Fulvivirga marina]MBL6447433.1 GAF domain-containing protein [Fulvivirga marina]